MLLFQQPLRFSRGFQGNKEPRANWERLFRGFHALGLFGLLRARYYPLRVRLDMVLLGVVGGLVVDASFSWELFPKVVACDCIRLVASI